MPKHKVTIIIEGNDKEELIRLAEDAVQDINSMDGKHKAFIVNEEHDPEKCGCEYKGNDMWSCGHIDNQTG